MYKYYTWTISNESDGLIITKDNWGNFTFNDVGTFTLTATNYIYNTNFINIVLIITVTIGYE